MKALYLVVKNLINQLVSETCLPKTHPVRNHDEEEADYVLLLNCFPRSLNHAIKNADDQYSWEKSVYKMLSASANVSS